MKDAPENQPADQHEPLAPQHGSTPIGEQPMWFLDPRREEDRDWDPEGQTGTGTDANGRGRLPGGIPYYADSTRHQKPPRGAWDNSGNGIVAQIAAVLVAIAAAAALRVPLESMLAASAVMLLPTFVFAVLRSRHALPAALITLAVLVSAGTLFCFGCFALVNW